MKTSTRGFTLIEMLIASGIAAILAATALPSFQGVLLKARRTDAVTSLLQLQMRQDQWRASRGRYADLAELNVHPSSSMNHYALQISLAGTSGYTLVATGTGTQAADGPCRMLRLIVADGHTTYASGADEQSTNTSAANRRCWNL